jgi:hypothetical protein
MTNDPVHRFCNSFSSAVYKQHRKETGCPPVLAQRLKPAHWGWYVEVKDGSFSIDAVTPQQAADVWEAKCRCIEGWVEQQDRKKQAANAGNSGDQNKKG